MSALLAIGGAKVNAPQEFDLEGFSNNINDLYGHFLVNRTSESRLSGGSVQVLSGAPFSSATIRARSIYSKRSDNALKPEWNDTVFALVQQGGRTLVRHQGHESHLKPHDAVVLSADRACELLVEKQSEAMVVHLPKLVVGSPEVARNLFGRRLSSGTALGRVVVSMLRTISSTPMGMADNERNALSESIHILFRELVSGDVDDPPGTGVDQYKAMKAFAEANLEDPSLSVEALADEMGLSVRSLYRAFAQHGDTPSSWLWRLRLETARERLASPRWRAMSITAIAYSVGFNDSAHFSRSFRKTFGISPRESRRLQSLLNRA